MDTASLSTNDSNAVDPGSFAMGMTLVVLIPMGCAFWYGLISLWV